MRVAAIMKKHGFVTKRVFSDGRKQRVWVKREDLEPRSSPAPLGPTGPSRQDKESNAPPLPERDVSWQALFDSKHAPGTAESAGSTKQQKSDP
jgi:hypothetical protein